VFVRTKKFNKSCVILEYYNHIIYSLPIAITTEQHAAFLW